jgi:flagellar FliL protein
MSQAESKAQPAKGKNTLIIIVAAVAVAGLAGGAAWWRLPRGQRGGEHTEAPKGAAEVASGVVALETFLVNLADKGGARYMRTTLKLVVPDEKIAEKVTKNEVAITRARSAILELLTTKTSDELVTAEGKTALKHAICERVSPVFGVEVSDVLFADFVVQY